MAGTRRVAFISVFAALGVVCDSLVTPPFSAGVWYGWIFMLAPITGVVLGPWDGFVATLISVMAGHSIAFRDVYEYVFTLGAPVCSMVSGLVYRGGLKRVFAYYTAMLLAYFLTPVSWRLPPWGMWDCYVAYAVLAVATLLGGFEPGSKRLYALSAFLGLEADVLFRIFLFVPCQTYRLFYGLTPEALALTWATLAPVITPIKVGLATLFAYTVCPHVVRALRRTGYMA